ncbi:MAG: MarR family winged helix-turn-helix transcriptional regulator [Armatimonadota bacterium]
MMKAFDPKQRHTPSGQITIALYRISQAIDYVLRERGKQVHLSPAQIQALLFLKNARPEAHTIGGLATRLRVTYATSSGVADALEQKRLVERIPLPEDQRVITLSLTSEGERQAEELENVLDVIENAVDALSDAEKSELLHATQAIVRRLQSAGYVRVYEMCWGCQFFRPNAHPNDPRGPHHCAFMDAPLPKADTYRECPDFVPAEAERG